MIDWSGFALKLSLPFIGILNDCSNPHSPINCHVSTIVLVIYALTTCSPSHLSTNNNYLYSVMS